MKRKGWNIYAFHPFQLIKERYLFHYCLYTFLHIRAFHLEQYHTLCFWQIDACVGTIELMRAEQCAIGIVSTYRELVFCLCAVNIYDNHTIESLHQTNTLAIALATLDISNAACLSAEGHRLACQSKFKGSEVWSCSGIADGRHSYSLRSVCRSLPLPCLCLQEAHYLL